MALGLSQFCLSAVFQLTFRVRESREIFKGSVDMA